MKHVVMELYDDFGASPPWPSRLGYTPWEVWYAWHPVKVRIVVHRAELHDARMEVAEYQWRWLVNVARRRRLGIRRLSEMYYKWEGAPCSWEYAPAAVAVTE